MKKITYELLTSPRHAHEKSIDIWTVIANMPDGTIKKDILRFSYLLTPYNVYYCDCPLCEWYAPNKNDGNCGYCPIKSCTWYDAPYAVWFVDKTAANAQAVLNQLHDTYKQRYGEEYRFNINTGTGEIVKLKE